MTVLLTALTQWGRGDMMRGDSGRHPFVFLAILFLFLALLAVIVVLVLRRPSHTHPTASATSPADNAHQILAARLARGEVTPDEYRERLAALASAPPPPT